MFFLVTLSTSTVSVAQQRLAPVEQLPEGRHVPGLLIDEVTHQFWGETKGRALAKSFGARGAQSIVGAPNALEYLSPRNSNTVQYGRAFLKIDRTGPVTFIVTGDISDSSVPFTACEIILRVSGQDVMYGAINTPGPSGQPRGGPIVGNVTLDPGYYRLEYVFAGPSVSRARYSIAIRSENDARPRTFLPAELFHVVP